MTLTAAKLLRAFYWRLRSNRRDAVHMLGVLPSFAGAALRLDPDEVTAVDWCDEAGYRHWQADGRPLSPVGRELAEAFWSGRWEVSG